MFFISKKRFDEAVEKRVREEAAHIEERVWREGMEQGMHELAERLTLIEETINEEKSRIGFQ